MDSRGGMVDLGALGRGASDPEAGYSEASAVNNNGQVVGNSSVATGEFHAFFWTAAGGMVDVGTLGDGSRGVSAVNEGGQVVDNSATAADEWHAFSWTAARGMVDLGTLAVVYQSELREDR